MSQIRDLVEVFAAHHEAGTLNTPPGQEALFRLVCVGDSALIATLHEHGLVPKPTGYRDNGVPVLDIGATAETVGIPVAKARAIWREMWPDVPVLPGDSDKIHRPH